MSFIKRIKYYVEASISEEQYSGNERIFYTQKRRVGGGKGERSWRKEKAGKHGRRETREREGGIF